MITVDELFSENFKPQWLIEKERLIKESFDYATSAGVELKYRQLSNESIKRIISNHYSPILPKKIHPALSM